LNPRLSFWKKSYKNAGIEPLSDENFYTMGQFAVLGIPREYVLAKRKEIASGCLDYPPLLLYPKMLWEKIPLNPEPSWSDRFVDEFYEYIESLGYKPEFFLHGKTIAQIINALFQAERQFTWAQAKEQPLGWERELSLLQKEIKNGTLPNNFLETHTIVEVVIELYRITVSGV
jgi:hypothetical protein